MHINKNYLLPIISGIILFLININDNSYIFLFIFLLPFLKFLDNIEKERESFWGGFLLGFTYYFLTLTIILWPSQETWFYIQNSNSLFMNYLKLMNPEIVLSAVLTFFSFLIGIIFGLFGYLAFVIYKKNKILFIVYLPFLWIACEYLKRKLLFDLSWFEIGYNAINYQILTVTAKVWGRYGIAFFIILINILFFYLITKKLKPVIFLILTVFIFAFLNLLGLFLISKDNLNKETKMKIAVVQGYLPWQIEHYQKNDETFDFPYPYNYFFNKLKNEKNYLDIILLPEEVLNSRPIYMKKINNKLIIENQNEFENERKYILEVIQRTKTSALVFGQKIIVDKINNYNGFVIFDNKGKAQFYLKNRLFPFVEEEKPIKLGLNNYKKSKSNPLLKIKNNFSLFMVGCVEIENDSLANKYLNDDPSLILAGGSEIGFNQLAQKYQIKLSRFRAIEQNRYLARALKGGYSAIIDNNGKIITKVKSNKENKVLIDDVYLIKNKTFYSKITPLIEKIIIVFIFLNLIVLMEKWCSKQK